MLVVIIIISIVTSLGANTYQEQRRQVQFNDSVLHVLQMIKTARNYAVTSRPYWNGTSNVVPPEGYGVYIERSANPGETRVVLFANTDATTDPIEKRDQFEEDGSNDDDLIEEEYFLHQEVDFEGLSTDLDTPPTPIGGFGIGADNYAVIIFRPPLAEVSLAVNDTPVTGNLVSLNDLYMRFRRAGTPASIPPTILHINHIAGFPETL